MTLPIRTAIAFACAILLLTLSRADAQTSPAPLPVDWRTVRVADGAFEIDFPKAPYNDVVGRDDASEVHGRYYAVNSPGEDLVLIAQFVDVRTGQFFVGIEALTSVARETATALGAREVQIDSTPIEGRHARRFSGSSDDAAFRGEVYLRGNRMHVVMSKSLRGRDEAVVSRFHDSFRFIEPRATQWIDVSLADRGYEVKLPSTPAYEEDTLGGGRVVKASAHGRDINTGQSYTTAVYTFSDYYSARDLDSHMLQMIIDDEDMPIVSDSTFTFQGVPARHLRIARGPARLPQHMRYIAKGRRLYEFSTIVGEPYLERDCANFFDSITLLGDDEPEDLFTSRTPRLLADLASGDSATHEAALAALGWISPRGDEAALLIAAFGRSYRDDDAPYARTRRRLLDRIVDAGGDDALEVVVSQYPTLDDGARVALVNHLLRREEEDAVETAVKLLMDYPLPDERWESIGLWYARQTDEDQMEILFPQLYRYLGGRHANEALLRQTAYALDNGGLEEDDIESHRETLLRIAGECAADRTDESEEGESELRTAALWFLDELAPTSETAELIARYAKDPSISTAHYAVCTLIEDGSPVPDGAIERIAARPAYRHSLYTVCTSAARLDLYPPELMTQSALAEAYAYDAVYDIEDAAEADTLSLVESRVVEFGGERGRAFLYALPSAEASWAHTILVGLLPIDGNCVASDYRLLVYGTESIEGAKIDEYFADLIAKAEREREEDEARRAARDADGAEESRE
jgi:hypothetical protein